MITFVTLQNLSFEIFDQRKQLLGSGISKVFLGSTTCKLILNNISVVVQPRMRLLFWKSTYEITIDKEISTIKPVRFFRGHYQLIHENDTYDYYLHNGNKSSLYKNQKQIASYTNKFIEFFRKSTCKIKSNQDENIFILVGFGIFLNLTNDDSEDVSFNMGNLLLEAKKNDPKWKPSQII